MNARDCLRGASRSLVTSEGPPAPPMEDTRAVLERIWRERQALGMVGRTRDEIDAGIAALRDELEGRVARVDPNDEATSE